MLLTTKKIFTTDPPKDGSATIFKAEAQRTRRENFWKLRSLRTPCLCGESRSFLLVAARRGVSFVVSKSIREVCHERRLAQSRCENHFEQSFRFQYASDTRHDPGGGNQSGDGWGEQTLGRHGEYSSQCQ